MYLELVKMLWQKARLVRKRDIQPQVLQRQVIINHVAISLLKNRSEIFREKRHDPCSFKEEMHKPRQKNQTSIDLEVPPRGNSNIRNNGMNGSRRCLHAPKKQWRMGSILAA